MKKHKSLEDELYVLGWIFLILGLIGAFIFLKIVQPHLPESTCLLWKYFGIYCPGCGGTRALIHLFHGRILESVWYHPLVVYAFGLYVAFMFTHTLRKLHIIKKGMKFREGYLYGALVVLAVNFILKKVLKFGFGIVMI